MVKKIVNGGIYWIDLKDIKKPEWGNSQDGLPHPFILIKIDTFDNREMFLSFPLTTSKNYKKIYQKRLFKAIKINEIENYILFNHVRTIFKSRILWEYKNTKTQSHIILKSNQLKEIKESYFAYYSYWMDNLINSKQFEKKSKNYFDKIKSGEYKNNELKLMLNYLEIKLLKELLEIMDIKIEETIKKKELISIIYENYSIE